MRIRDAVVGDIVLNNWEEQFIRTASFQRLHRIKQLGNAFHAYPSAMHTRFEHSLGVCHQIKNLLQPNFYPTSYKPNDDESKILRLAGLLHDIVHTPFKHTLEHDTGVLVEEKEADDYQFWIDKMISENPGIPNIIGKDNITIVLKILSEKADNLDVPFHKEIVEDTISADLLDYTWRDAYYTVGRSRQWDQRIYDHIVAAPNTDHKLHLAAKIVDDEGKPAESAVTELTNLMQIRYMLTERVYYYPVKMSADALLTKSVRELLSSGISSDQFRETKKNMSDEDLIQFLASNKNENVSYYAKSLRDRILPKLIKSYKPNDLTGHQEEKVCEYFRGCNNLENWTDREGEIAKRAGINGNDIIIYCHDPGMRKKIPDFPVLDESLETTSVRNKVSMWNDLEAIAKKHQNLWKCYVFSLNRDPVLIKKIEATTDEYFHAIH
jgi:uncharacterized protein